MFKRIPAGNYTTTSETGELLLSSTADITVAHSVPAIPAVPEGPSSRDRHYEQLIDIADEGDFFVSTGFASAIGGIVGTRDLWWNGTGTSSNVWPTGNNNNFISMDGAFSFFDGLRADVAPFSILFLWQDINNYAVMEVNEDPTLDVGFTGGTRDTIRLTTNATLQKGGPSTAVTIYKGFDAFQLIQDAERLSATDGSAAVPAVPARTGTRTISIASAPAYNFPIPIDTNTTITVGATGTGGVDDTPSNEKSK